jgi:hypothetical protein
MQTRKWLITLVVAGVLTALGLLIFKSRQLPPSPPLPSPNGHDDFVKAGQMLASNTSDYHEMSDEELRQLVTQNAEALSLVRTGLGRECRVPLVDSQAYMGSHLSELASIYTLARALDAEGRLAESEHRNREAVEAHLDTMRLGQEATRGGVLSDGYVGIACEAIGAAGLQNLVTNLNAEECRKLLDALETIAKKQESFEEVMKHDREWSQRANPLYYPLYQRIVASFMRLLNLTSTTQAERKAALKFQTREQRQRALLIAVATRAYELEKGRRPKSIAE